MKKKLALFFIFAGLVTIGGAILINLAKQNTNTTQSDGYWSTYWPLVLGILLVAAIIAVIAKYGSGNRLANAVGGLVKFAIGATIFVAAVVALAYYFPTEKWAAMFGGKKDIATPVKQILVEMQPGGSAEVRIDHQNWRWECPELTSVHYLDENKNLVKVISSGKVLDGYIEGPGNSPDVKPLSKVGWVIFQAHNSVNHSYKFVVDQDDVP